MKNNNKADNIYIIIVVYNGENWIRKCLESLQKNTDREVKIKVIDNCSKDKTGAIVLNEFKTIEFIPMEKNKGYGSACNKGIELAYKAGADYIVVLNQDVIVENNWLGPLIEAAVNYPEIGIISPFQIGYNNDKPDINQEIILKKHMINMAREVNFGPEIYPVHYLIGACLFLPRKTIEKVGGFDTEYFMYGEETDLCERIIYHGMYPAIVKNSVIRHNSARDGYDLSSKMSKYYFRNQYRLFLKNPHSSFEKNIYSYLRCVMADITLRLWEEFNDGKSGISHKALFVYRFIFSQWSIILSIYTIYRSQKLSRAGLVHIKI